MVREAHNTIRRAGVAPDAMAIRKYSSCATIAWAAIPSAKQASFEKIQAVEAAPSVTPVKARERREDELIDGAQHAFAARVSLARQSSRKYMAYLDTGSSGFAVWCAAFVRRGLAQARVVDGACVGGKSSFELSVLT